MDHRNASGGEVASPGARAWWMGLAGGRPVPPGTSTPPVLPLRSPVPTSRQSTSGGPGAVSSVV